ncbi:PAS domain S-box protein [Belnapia sp. T6]|uniref:histidine kinase n=1 Tax=Belnapia mucosa TaxID=2804532 RepID=A0ABS1V9Q2_9PROT|nr:PAS domain S-box protein [Belnapia mucosa]MBL6458402.1 PAS domain S-box protein [Belnapia mucosa]
MNAEPRTGFPAAPREMGTLIQAQDWAATPLGPIGGWPQSLRTTVEILLAHSIPMVALWGEQLVQIYNDGYRALMGGKHPAGLGQPHRDSWPEIWHIDEPIFRRVRQGETLSYEDKFYPVARHGLSEEAWFSLTYSPLRDEAGAVAGVLVTVVETTDRIRARAARQESERRLDGMLVASGLSADFRALFEAAPAPFLVVAPRGLQIVAANEAYLRATMTDRAALLGRMIFDAFPADPADPDQSGVANLRASLERVIATRSTDVMPVQRYPIRRPEAQGGFEERWWAPVNSPVLGRNGEIAFIIHRVEDVTAQFRAEAAQRESEERFRLIVENTQDYAIFTTDAEDRIDAWFPGAARVFGWSAEEAVGQPAAILFTPEDREHGVPEAEVETARRDGAAANVRWHSRKDGSRVFIEGSTRALRGPDGVLEGFLKIGQDVTERRASEERQRLLMREVDHRAKNALAVVQTVLRLTRADDMPSFVKAIEGRVAALARAQTLLAEQRWHGADLRALLLGELAPFLAGQRADLAGPRVFLPAAMAQPMAMAVHELATNALKHGALSVPEGRIAVAWSLTGGSPGVLRLRWSEAGGPPVEGTPMRRGFGSRVLEGTVRDQLGGAVALRWERTGLLCEFEVPLRRGG